MSRLFSMALLGFTLAFGTGMMNSSVVSAQSPILAEMYGRGVHQYFAGDVMGAHQSLTAAIDAGSEDPRAYYFRGLANAATGRLDEAQADWRQGAILEGTSSMAGGVGMALRRVQGSTRMQLEQVRQETRLKERNQLQARNRSRVEEMRQVESRILRQGAGAGASATAAAPAAAPSAGAAASPFARDAANDPAPTVMAEDALKDPFADDPAGTAAAPAASAPAASDGFGMPSADAPAADPFGSAAPATAPAADPFGAAPAAGGAAPMADPFGAGGDPFAPAK